MMATREIWDESADSGRRVIRVNDEAWRYRASETGYEAPTWFPRGRNASWINMKVLGFLIIGGRKVAHHLRSAAKLLTVHLQRGLARNRPPQPTTEDIARAVDIAVEIERERHERYPFEWE
jgi:hypothetical protein